MNSRDLSVTSYKGYHFFIFVSFKGRRPVTNLFNTVWVPYQTLIPFPIPSRSPRWYLCQCSMCDPTFFVQHLFTHFFVFKYRISLYTYISTSI